VECNRGFSGIPNAVRIARYNAESIRSRAEIGVVCVAAAVGSSNPDRIRQAGSGTGCVLAPTD